MSFNIADYTNISSGSGIIQASGGKGAKSSNPSFFDMVLNHLPDKKATVADIDRERTLEKRQMLNQVLEWMRIESHEKRMELLAKLMQKGEEEKPYDLFTKCLDIARRIMRGEKVSVEEMRLLAQHFPDLLFQALLLKQEENDDDEGEKIECQSDDNASSDDSGSIECNVMITGAAE